MASGAMQRLAAISRCVCGGGLRANSTASGGAVAPFLSAPFYALSAKDIDDDEVAFSQFAGQAVLIGNVASAWGNTKKHYAELVELHKAYVGRLVILAFPCNQFGQQEPGSSFEIKRFAESKGVPCRDKDLGFLLMEKIDVNADHAHAVYQYLKGATSDSSDVKWNFASYWLIDPSGGVKRLQGARNTPANFISDIDTALGA